MTLRQDGPGASPCPPRGSPPASERLGGRVPAIGASGYFKIVGDGPGQGYHPYVFAADAYPAKDVVAAELHP